MVKDGNGAREWIESGGGPLIVVPEQVLTCWQGCDFESATGDDDYSRACEVEGYLGVIPVGRAEALVLGEPWSTTYVAEHGCFVCRIGADSEDALLDSVEQALEAASWEEQVTWEVPGPVVLLDSGRPGVPGPDAEFDALDRLRIDLAAGRYLVRAAHAKPGPTTTTVLVGLTRLPPDSPEDLPRDMTEPNEVLHR
ncbi:Imm21 family immunity protein [Streptomyces sp. NPDC007369]|uniref:Imm21 family immunity protein n=1 Tax=Streptomyces sp. NPDC007369 TaxID=3154589 RepID=UPI0033CE1D79